MTPVKLAPPSSEDAAKPDVQLAGSGPPLILVISGFVLVGLLAFVVIDGQRKVSTPTLLHTRTDGAVVNAVMPSPPKLDVPPPPPPAPVQPPAPVVKYIDRPAPPPIIQYVERPAPPAPPPPPPNPIQTAKLAEPSLVIDLGQNSTATANADEASAHAVVLRNKSLVIPQGALIPAVIETPIDTAAPGPIRAVTSGDTKGFDGTRVLIPRGSRLTGELKGDVQPGQNRVQITWTRLVRPDGVAIRLASPTTDQLGQAGAVGKLDTHLLQRVGAAVLESTLTVGVALASRPGNGSVVLGLPSQGATNIVQTLAPTGEFKPTIKVAPGTTVMVFVAHDLDFTGAVSRR